MVLLFSRFTVLNTSILYMKISIEENFETNISCDID